jgi:hypothetical protein
MTNRALDHGHRGHGTMEPQVRGVGAILTEVPGNTSQDLLRPDARGALLGTNRSTLSRTKHVALLAESWDVRLCIAPVVDLSRPPRRPPKVH